MQESAYTLDRSNEEAILQKLQDGRELLLSELHRVIVGQEEVIEQLLIVLFSGCHCLITGAPGLAKTRLIRSLAEIIDLDFKRIQFTPDLMPSDIIGTEIIDENRQTGHREMRFYQGPILPTSYWRMKLTVLPEDSGGFAGSDGGKAGHCSRTAA